MYSYNHLFIRFLKKEKIYEQFIYNFYKLNTHAITFKQFTFTTSPFEYFRLSFQWCSTKEGSWFWYEYSQKWDFYLYSLNDQTK